MGARAQSPPDEDSSVMANTALAISVLATLICLFQVLQQYAAAGSPMRLCDSIVYGGRRGLPGQGRRVWVWKQFRYRIIYEIPRISLVPLNPSLGAFVPYLIKPSPSFDWPAPEQKLMSQLQQFDTGRQTGEAAWVSFSRVLLMACPGSVIVNRVGGDADRCPLDMTVIPMPVSMRDMAFFALAIGMECVDASFASQSMTLRGQIGTITSSQHPLLGPVLHYAPPQDGFMLDQIGTKIDPAWILRVCGRLRVGSIVLRVVDFARPHRASDSSTLGHSNRSSEEQITHNLDPDQRPQSSESSSDNEKACLAQVPHRSDTLTSIDVARIDWRWLSQIPVIPGFWATPFKSHVKVETCWGAHRMIMQSFYGLFCQDTSSGFPPISFSTFDDLQVLCGLNITTFPPYGLTRTGEPMIRETIESFAQHFEFAESASFDCEIPKIVIRRASTTPAAHAVLDDHNLCTIDVMGLDIWLDIVGKTEPIYAGLGLVNKHMPSIVSDIMTTLSPDFAKCGSHRDGTLKVQESSRTLQDVIQASGLRWCSVTLSGAEQMYVLVALLRTVKVGLCIGLGNDTSILMEILQKDIQAHLL